MIFFTDFLWSKVGGRCRQKLQRCVTFGVRSWHPSQAYVGFYEVDDYSVHREAEDISDSLLIYGGKLRICLRGSRGLE